MNDEIMFPNIDDVDYFLENVLKGYRRGQFDQSQLKNFTNNIERSLRARINKAHTGFGKLENIGFGRYVIATALETLCKIHCSQKNTSVLNILKVEVSINDQVVCYFYHNVLSNKEDWFIIKNGEINYNEFKSFAISCIPDLVFDQTTFADAEGLCKYLYKIQVDKFTQ